MTNEQLELVSMIRQANAESHEELKAEIQAVRAELRAEIQAARTELKAEIQELRTEMNARFEKVDDSMDYVRAKISEHDEDVFRIKRLLKAVT